MNQLQPEIHVILRHADQMPNAQMAFVLVFLIILVIQCLAVILSVFWTQNVHVIKLVFGINARIHVLVIYAVAELFATLLIMWRCAVVRMECRAMRILHARQLYNKVWPFGTQSKILQYFSIEALKNSIFLLNLWNIQFLLTPCNSSHSNKFFVGDPVPNACIPSPCGPNSQCHDVNSQAICSCVPGYLGDAPYCKPECLSPSDCALIKTCVNQKCVDPCAGACGLQAKCEVINHNAVCYCPNRFTGDPFNRCSPVAIGISCGHI